MALAVSKVWHSTDPYKTVIWRCNQKYNSTTQRASGGSKCNTGHVTEEQVYRAFQGIVNKLIAQRPEVVAACEAVLRELMSTADLDKAENRLNGEKERIQAKAVALNNEASHRLIADFGERRGELERKLSQVEEKLKAVNSERSDREYKARQCVLFLDRVKRLNLVDAETFMALVDKVVVGERMKFILKDGSEWGTIEHDGGVDTWDAAQERGELLQYSADMVQESADTQGSADTMQESTDTCASTETGE